ncbi:hypothetical protein NPIL_360621 [Nephila pilipes]|uniref:Uncharacterized protein n=1 Tax=Nephila pilipes TaxID=299642 RepID=A0A8X6TXD6_NEPPI|nr:hypothetical protein NPIL_360621 [Nephila pilipes]
MRSALHAGAVGCPQVRLQLRLMYGSRDFNNRIPNDPEVKQGHAELYLFGIVSGYDSSGNLKKMAYSREHHSKPYATKRSSPDSKFDKTYQTGCTPSLNRGDKLKTDNRSERLSVSCYGCGMPDVTKPRCPNCKQTANKDTANFGNISLHS